MEPPGASCSKDNYPLTPDYIANIGSEIDLQHGVTSSNRGLNLIALGATRPNSIQWLIWKDSLSFANPIEDKVTTRLKWLLKMINTYSKQSKYLFQHFLENITEDREMVAVCSPRRTAILDKFI